MARAPSRPLPPRPLASQIYALGVVLRKSATESYKNGLNLGSTEWPIVATLVAGPATLAELCERLGRDKGQASRDITGLIAQGYLVKARHPLDSRQVVIDLNRDDKALLQEAERIIAERDRVLTEGLSAAERKQLEELLAKLDENARHPRMSRI